MCHDRQRRATALLQSTLDAICLGRVERLADDAAEGELADLGISEARVLGAIAELIDRLRP